MDSGKRRGIVEGAKGAERTARFFSGADSRDGLVRAASSECGMGHAEYGVNGHLTPAVSPEAEREMRLSITQVSSPSFVKSTTEGKQPWAGMIQSLWDWEGGQSGFQAGIAFCGRP